MAFAAVATGIAVGVGTKVVGDALFGDNGAGAANDAATNATNLQAQIARDQWDRYKTIYSPLEESYVKESQNYASPENYARAAGDASATVSDQFSKARDRLTRTPGVDPSTAGYASNMVGLNLAQAATDAAQQNAARKNVTDTAYARKTDALSLGKGLPAQASSALNSASGNSLDQARYANQINAANANGLGSVVNRAMNPGTTSNWLGSGSTAGYALGTTSVSPQVVQAANQTSDPLGSLITAEGWTP